MNEERHVMLREKLDALVTRWFIYGGEARDLRIRALKREDDAQADVAEAEERVFALCAKQLLDVLDDDHSCT